MPLLALKGKQQQSPAEEELQREEQSPGQAPLYLPFDVPGNTALLVIPQGSIVVPSGAGASPKANPLPLINAGMLVGLILEETITGTYTLAAGTGAITYANSDPDAPYSHLQLVNIKFGGRNPAVSASGRALRAFLVESVPAFQDDVTYVSLPTGNSGTTSETVNFTHKIYWYVPIAASLDWPMGLVMLANKNVVVTVDTQWTPWPNMLTLPSGDTVSVTSDECAVYAVAQAVPADAAALPSHYLQYAHTLIEYTKPATQARTVLNMAEGNDGDIVRLGVSILLPNGTRDYQNTTGLNQVILRFNGVDYNVELSPGAATFLRNMRARRLTLASEQTASAETGVGATGTDGVIWLPLDIGGGRNWIPADKLADLRLELDFGTAPPNGTSAAVIVEQIQQMVVSNG
jgi:hypothetical protein